MDAGESPAEVEAKIERMFKGQPKVRHAAASASLDHHLIESCRQTSEQGTEESDWIVWRNVRG